MTIHAPHVPDRAASPESATAGTRKAQPVIQSRVGAPVALAGLAIALISISSIHLLRTFINAPHVEDRVIITQVTIHAAFLLSAIAIAYTDKIMMQAIAARQSSQH